MALFAGRLSEMAVSSFCWSSSIYGLTCDVGWLNGSYDLSISVGMLDVFSAN